MIKIKVGTFVLETARNVDIPQAFAAWHQTVRVEPGTYDVFAYLEDMGYLVRSLSVECEGITISSYFRSHMLGQWGKNDNNRNGQRATAHIHLPTAGGVGEADGILAHTTLCDALIREEWDPREYNPASTCGRRWRFVWNKARKPLIIELVPCGGTSLAAFEDHRRFRVDAAEMSPDEVHKLRLHFNHMSSVDQLCVGETREGWSFADKKSIQVTRLV